MAGEDTDDREEALTKLRELLADELANARLAKAQLAIRASLGRTTVSEAYQVGGPMPSAVTVAALARALKLPNEKRDLLLALRRRAAGEGGEGPIVRGGPGRPVEEWDPHDLEVHPAGTEPGAGMRATRALSGYARRRHDEVLAEVVRAAVAAGRSGMVVLVGSSSTGKTRACWEAVRALAGTGWRLWHPFEPTRADAALANLEKVGPQTVVWLNEAQHYLGDPNTGERVAAALHSLLTDPERAPVVVFGTLWPEYVEKYTALPPPGAPDTHSRLRELLSGRTVIVPEAFDEAALDTARDLAAAGDELLRDALGRVEGHGRLAQDLAGGPELLRRYQQGTPSARALLEAAMDARRLGVGLHLPQAFLIDAAEDYFSDHDYNYRSPDWAEAAFAALAEPVHGKQAPLTRTATRPARRPPGGSVPAEVTASVGRGTAFRLADYLEQHGRAERWYLCPPASFWHSAHTHLTHAEDLTNLSLAAQQRWRRQWAHHLRQRALATDTSNRGPRLIRMAEVWEKSGDREIAEALAREAAADGSPYCLTSLAKARAKAGDRKGAEALLLEASAAGDFDSLTFLLDLWERGEGPGRAETLLREVADAGNADALIHLASLRERAGDPEAAEAFLREAADAGRTHALLRLSYLRMEVGDHEGAETLAHKAAAAGDSMALSLLAELREAAGDREGAEALAREAAADGDSTAASRIVERRENAGDHEEAETLALRTANAGSTEALDLLLELREEAGDREGAETLAFRAAGAGHAWALHLLAEIRHAEGDHKGAELLAREAADANDPFALAMLAEIREDTGDCEEAETLAFRAAGAGNVFALPRLGLQRERSGNHEGADAFARKVSDAGYTMLLASLAQMRARAGDRESAEILAHEAASARDPDALVLLGELCEEAGNHERAEALFRAAANTGEAKSLRAFARWPHGLEPDGSPTPPWFRDL
ncbi:hypothetical protein JIX56_41075 [Streptomyces sp. CA-210063]|uniref:tetratricopeptide repeat protein n=1 Tax=Streptomyces sp. CA-210063 TaxID=2801029 RepID=UPI00214BA828|nr:hypothetical protein [Streptomyces sp. CA-210063]UUU35733.1 hypothetical protein JIX56_41075 [Streptomyces sp. CA-210063]